MLRMFVTDVPSDDSSAGAVFGLLWGLFATAFGVLVASNYRGFFDRFFAVSESSAAWLRRIPPWRWISDQQLDRRLRLSRTMARVTGWVFAVLGPPVLVISAIQLATGPWRPGPIRLHPHVTVASVFPGVMILAAGTMNWFMGKPGASPLRDAWRRGRVLPRLAAAGATLAIIVMAAGVMIQLWPLFLLGWAAGMIPGIALFFTWHHSPAVPPTTSHDDLSQQRPTDSSAG